MRERDLRILFDYQTFTIQQVGGISRYFCALAGELAGYPDTWVRVVAPVHLNTYLAKAKREVAFGCYVGGIPKKRAVSRALSSLLFAPIARAARPDIVHETYYAPRAPGRGIAHRVLTVFDMTHEKLPHEFSASDKTRQLKAAAVGRADRIVCISENTRRDLLDTLSCPEDKVTVTYLGYDPLHANGQSAAALVGAGPYLLHVGARKGYKNFAGLARAFAASSWLKENFRLICFGGRGFSSAERAMLAELKLGAERVLHIAGDDERLAALYAGAAAFVYPSKYEGFGIPPLEAMSLDCPVICGAISSIPEVVGEAGEYFDPDDIESMRDAMERVLQSSTRRQELVQLGRERCRLFTWERCARETRDVYRTLIP